MDDTKLKVEGAKQVVPLVAQYVRDLADMLVGYIKVNDAVGAISCLSSIEEAISPSHGDGGEPSRLATAFVMAIGGGAAGLLGMLLNDTQTAPAVSERRQKLRADLANAIGLDLEEA